MWGHSFEKPRCSFEQPACEALPPEWAWEEGDDDDDDDSDISAEEAGSEFADYIMKLKIMNTISAKDLCILCFDAARAGLQGPASEWGKPHSTRSGHFQRHLDAKLSSADMLAGLDTYELQVPIFDKHMGARVTAMIPIVLPHETLHDEFEATPGMSHKVLGIDRGAARHAI